MESNSVTQQITNSTMPYETSLEAYNNPEAQGIVIRYDTIEYRGETIDFLSSVDGVQCFARWDGQLVDLGINNIYYKEDMCRFVDRQLDLITTFRDCSNFVGAKLEYFRNGEYRDIRLSYKGRILKVFLVAGKVNETFLISESKKILLSSGLLEDEQKIK